MMFRSIVSAVLFVISVVALPLIAQAEDAGCYPAGPSTWKSLL